MAERGQEQGHQVLGRGKQEALLQNWTRVSELLHVKNCSTSNKLFDLPEPLDLVALTSWVCKFLVHRKTLRTVVMAT